MEETQYTRPPIEIYQESTPNPHSLKFVCNQMIFERKFVDCKNMSETKGIPLAEALFRKFDYIEGVFISNNFITLTKRSSQEWHAVLSDIKTFLKTYLYAGKPIVTEDKLEELESAQKKEQEPSLIDDKIKALLDKYVRPTVEMDGGHISFKSFEKGIVTLSLQGACSGCPSSSVTLKSGIETMLKRIIPEVKEVVAEAE